jgi:heme A synthase
LKLGPTLFRLTAIVVVVQLLMGGLLTFDFISPEPHIVVGFIVFILAIVTMVASFVAKPSFRPLKIMSVALVILVFAQGILGFITLGTGSEVLAWIHFTNALVIYGIAVSAAFMSMRWDGMAKNAAATSREPQTQGQ